MRTLSTLALVLAGCAKSASPPVEPAPPSSPEGNVDIADDALPLVDAWAEALGGRQAIAKLGTVHQKGDCTIAGRTCTFESFVSPGGELRYGVTFPDGGFVVGFDGTSGWRQEGGTVTDLAGAELEKVLRPAFLESHSMFFPDRQHGSVTREGTSSLAIVPRGVATPLVVRFRTDGLPVSNEAPGFRLVFQSWNEYLGVQIAQSWTSGPTGTENTFRLSRIDDEAGTYTKPAP